MQISSLTGLLYCVNFNLHGAMKPSTVSVVDPQTMTEIKQIRTGVMPHGSRISTNGRYQYSVAMMSGELFVEGPEENRIKARFNGTSENISNLI